MYIPIYAKRLAAVTAAVAFVLGSGLPAAAGEGAIEIGAGGLSFASNPSIKLEQQDVVIAPDKVTVTYTLHNEATTPQAVYAAFLLPDLDANAITEGEIALNPADAANYVQYVITVDGQPIAVRTEQRAMALGLDISAMLAAADVPVFPFAETLTTKLEALTPETKLELLERGAIKEDGSAVLASWVLKTVAYWRQPLAAGQTITIRHAYRPVAATTSINADALPTWRNRMCLNETHEAAIAKLPTVQGAEPQATAVTYTTTPGADAFGGAKRFRLIIETGDAQTIVASCREGLRQTGPMQFEWTSADFVPDEDFQILFAR